MTGLSLFSGNGGIDLALGDYVETIGYCEQDEYAQHLLASRMAEGLLTVAPIYPDVQKLRGKPGDCEIIFGGFPCQDISVAGHGKGLEGQRSGLFFEVIRLTKEISPNFVFLENVPAIRTRGLFTVLQEFTSIGYDCRWTIVSAQEVGACHRRQRWFLLAHNRSKRIQGSIEKQILRKPTLSWCQDGGRLKDVYARPDLYEPKLCRNCNDVAFGVDRIKSLGNGVVPLQVKTAFERLMGLS